MCWRAASVLGAGEDRIRGKLAGRSLQREPMEELSADAAEAMSWFLPGLIQACPPAGSMGHV